MMLNYYKLRGMIHSTFYTQAPLHLKKTKKTQAKTTTKPPKTRD